MITVIHCAFLAYRVPLAVLIFTLLRQRCNHQQLVVGLIFMRNTSTTAAAAAALHAAVLPFHLARTLFLSPSPSPPALVPVHFPLSSLSRSTRSLKVSFARATAVRHLFERRLPSGLKTLQLTLSPPLSASVCDLLHPPLFFSLSPFTPLGATQ